VQAQISVNAKVKEGGREGDIRWFLAAKISQPDILFPMLWVTLSAKVEREREREREREEQKN
jgi:hypothetical protein